MTVDINGLSAKELRALITEAQKRQTTILTRPKASAMRAKINQYVKDHGYTIEELYGPVAGTKASGGQKKPKASKGAKRFVGSKVAAKFRNPSNPEETWSGRGRSPRWMTALVAKGKSPNDFLIK